MLLSIAAFTACILTSPFTHATVWRVNNKATGSYGENYGGSINNPVFPQIDNALTWVPFQNGDTLHVEGSNIQYNDANIHRPAVIIGPGYFLSANPKVTAMYAEAHIFQMYFYTGSGGSKIYGMCFDGQGSANVGLRIYTDSITIRRCYFGRSIVFYGPGHSTFDISQNFFSNSWTTTLGVFEAAGGGFTPPSDVIFNNNICQLSFDWLIGQPFLQCNNNVFDCNSVQLLATEFYNNIFVRPTFTFNVTGNVEYCVSSNFIIPAGNNNINNAIISNWFPYLFSATTDSLYLLSPGMAAGSNGYERGVYGGPPQSRYVQSGLAPIPVIYEAFTDGIAIPGTGIGTGLPVRLRARTIK